MSTKFSEDVIPSSDLKVNPDGAVRRTMDSSRSVLPARRGRGVAVVRSVRDYESVEDKRGFMRAVDAGLADVEAGREMSLADAKSRLGLK